MKYKENQKVIITECNHGHQFKIGETVKIIEELPDGSPPHYKARDSEGKEWWIQDDEIKAKNKKRHV